MKSALVRLALPLLLLVSSAAASSAADLYSGDAGECARDGVLSRIASRFSHQVRHVPHLPDVAIERFDRVHEHRFVPASHAAATSIDRRYCMATATLSDGRHRSVWYMIEYGQGFASIGDNVEFCVAGFDRWKVYDRHCRVTR